MIRKNDFLRLIAENDFRELFVGYLGWNVPRFNTHLPVITIDETEYYAETIAELKGFQIVLCKIENLPNSSTCRKLDSKIRRQANDYISIFTLGDSDHHLWMVPVKNNEKRDLVIIEYENAQQSDFLYSKIDDITFELGEEVHLVDIKARVQHAFVVNSEKITKTFYSEFRKHHRAFSSFISGIDDDVERNNHKKEWYTSVMLNRLMFCYFIQKKGFLNDDKDYLRKKLDWVKREKGENHFFKSFYRGFLIQLFHEGLNTPTHTPEWERTYGKIPYLNGGMFDEHQLEREYLDIDIKDEAFEKLFDFFDEWNWYLDTRITASGKDINPDVLGYIFEQYINDRAAMGAYYTKEDITEYIGKNCILPFLMDRLAETDPKAFKADGEVWTRLKESGDAYIYDAVKRGYIENWQSQIPEEIAQGIDTQKPNLLERRADWNTPTPNQWALPTEIWRETIERLQRCDMLLSKIKGGEITAINDFITYNLDIRSFVYDLLQKTEDNHLVLHFYKALQKVTILDPTCGSGAFLFAAMNILEPLYEVCIERMQEWNEKTPALFKEQLAEITNKYRSNIQYFIFKSIILRNLYGVDIMVEATEIAKLRLFLKMVAVVEVDRRADNMGLDPLPDIDFNIRSGNTLVGYATEEQLNKDLSFASDIMQVLANKDFKYKIDKEMALVATTYNIFKQLQLTQDEDLASFKRAKEKLHIRLNELNKLLNQRLFSASGTGNYQDWLKSHQPFHWLAEFYQIMHDNGGFDVIIGNPPYVEYNKRVNGIAISDIYQISGYETLSCGNLYAFVLERSKYIICQKGYVGMIVPLSGHSTDRMSPLVTNFYKKFGLRLHLNLSADANPQKLFEGVKFRLCIFLVSNSHNGTFASKYTRWFAEERNHLFTAHIQYNDIRDFCYNNIVPKIASPLQINILNKVKNEKRFFFSHSGNAICYYHNAPVNWIRAHSFVPFFTSERDGEGITTQLKTISFPSQELVNISSCLINSSLFFIWWLCNSDCYHLNKPEIENFGFNVKDSSEFNLLSSSLSDDMKRNSVRRVYNYRTSGRVEYDEFYMKKSKTFIDEIDKVLAKHYGFTDEELDFIINYDIKYRMGDELNNN